ncbi:MAG: ankyrin repeat domain-containing protein [Planctomycetota bacterium]|nr:ankyrin repeat domain-containing protein [Planctomycetota bacterium]
MKPGAGDVEPVGAFVDACIERHDEARRLAAADPTLLRATWAGDPLLHWFVIEDFQGAAQLVLDLGAAIDERDEDGRTALHYACSFGRLGMVRLLLQRGADRDLVNEHFHENPLHLATAGTHLGVVLVLLQHGARADYVLKTLDTIFRAMRNWPPEVRDLLLPDLRACGVTRESVFAKLAGIYESPEQAFGW